MTDLHSSVFKLSPNRIDELRKPSDLGSSLKYTDLLPNFERKNTLLSFIEFVLQPK